VLVALTRGVGPDLTGCELTHLPRRPIDVAAAREQHAAYERCLAALGCELRRLPEAPELPDAVFVEDTAVVLDELAVLARPGAESRRAELSAVEEALAACRRLHRIEAPGTLDGGDVLVLGRLLYVGLSRRTNAAGAQQLGSAVAPYGYRMAPVAIEGCLHLKSAVTRVGGEALLIQRAWVAADAFVGWDLIDVDPGEPQAANALRVGETVVVADAYPRTRERLERRGLAVFAVDLSELAKAEAGVTCCSLIFRP
jgi:dimethylargininase